VRKWALAIFFERRNGKEMTDTRDITSIEKQIKKLRDRVMRDMEVLVTLEEIKLRYYKKMMRRKDKHEDE